ncbi:MAG: DUF4058 family protein [Chloroflexi bacterium]|nr:DUF4058 family protein [Chloroflexota bacterium]
MPSPFPGMDPFLEDPAGWPDVHARVITAMSDYLLPRLLPNFYVRIQERVYISSPDDEGREALAPDLFVTTGRPAQPVLAASATISESVLVETLLDPDIHDRYLEIYDARSREVVTAIELMSPANKVVGADGREAFIAKRRAIRAAGAHWIEIDLLRAGWRHEDLAGRSDYCALLARAGGHSPRQVWFCDVRDRLPTIAVPLRPPFEDVPLELQAVLDDAYSRAHYDDTTDYTTPIPPPRLRPADAAWAEAQVREWLAARAVRRN